MKSSTIAATPRAERGTRTTTASLLPWVPRLIMLAAATCFGILFALGGMSRVLAWGPGRLALLVLGAIVFASTALYALVRRRIDRGAILTGCMSLLLCLPPAILMVEPVAYPASISSTKPSATVRLPANVPLKVIWGGDALDGNRNHAALPNQRWAYDFLVTPYKTGSANLEDYGCYGVPVVAPVAGTIAAAHDGEPDAAPGELPQNHTALALYGNYVVIRLDETVTYLALAHLRPGSLKVTAGERVEEGQVIAQCGNSGNSSEPHLHLHHQRQDPSSNPLVAEGLPLYFRDHDGPAMPEGGMRIENGNVIATGPTVQHIGQ